MIKQDSSAQLPITRPIPDRAIVDKELHRIYETKSQYQLITIKMKLHNPGDNKVKRLLSVHHYVTDLKGNILLNYEEDVYRPRTNGAIALVLRIPRDANNRSDTISNDIRKEFVTPNRGLTDFLFAGRLREAVAREAAGILIRWVDDICTYALKGSTYKGRLRRISAKKARQIKLTVDEVYAAWLMKLEAYERAASTIIPFGRYRGKALWEVGRRDARWLLEHLLPKEQIAQTLEYVETLLEEGQDLMDDAAYVEHPYRFDQRTRIALRASRLVQRILDPDEELVLLGMLKRTDLERLRKELKEMHEKGITLDHELDSVAETLKDMYEGSKYLQTVQDALETFLYEKPRAFPTIAQSRLPEAQAVYEARLAWYSPNRYRPRDIEKYVSEKLERQANERFEKASAEISRQAKFHPIPFIASMRPGDYGDFALLFDKDTGEYVLAARLRGRGDRITPEEQQERIVKRARQRRSGKLYYANRPETLFNPGEDIPIELYPLTWGEHEPRIRRRFLKKRVPFLRAIIEQQRTAQHTVYTQKLDAGAPVPLAECQPDETPFGSAKIVMQRGIDNQPEFYAHLSVKLRIVEYKPLANAVIGFHQHRLGYSYAVVDLNGNVMHDSEGHELVGDLEIPRHVDVEAGAKANSSNYVFEVANAMIRQAGNALIGIEDTRWQKDRPDLSRELNRLTFSRPSRRIQQAAKYKAKLAGFPRLRVVGNVSPFRDCATCLSRLPEGTSGLYVWHTITCPSCKESQVFDILNGEHTCEACQHTWLVDRKSYETHHDFRCPVCESPSRSACHNTAIVVAQQTLRSLEEADSEEEDFTP